MKKRLICMVAVFLTLTLLGILPMGVRAQNTEEPEFSYTLEDGVLKVYGNGEMPRDWDPVDGETFTRAEIGEGVTTLNDRLFYNCDSLESVSLPSTLAVIEAYAFYDCDNLKEIQIPEGVTQISDRTFYSCDMLRAVELPSHLEIICSAAFASCKSLPEIRIPEGVKEIQSDAFSDSKALRAVTLPQTLKTIGERAFDDCPGIRSLTIPEGVESIGRNAFSNDSGLTELSLPSTLEEIGEYAFSNCDGLKTVQVPDSVHTIGNGIFHDCDALTEAVLGSGLTVVTDQMFYDCDALKNVSIADGVKTISRSAFDQCGNLTELRLPDTLETIAASAFSDCARLKEIALPDGVKELGAYSFYRCAQLTTVRLPDTLQSIGEYAFAECSALNTIRIPEKVRVIAPYTFYSCTGLVSVELPQTMERMESYAFHRCTQLKSVTIPEGITDVLEGCFSGCSRLESVSLPSTLIAIRYEAFSQCTALTRITIPEGVTDVEGRAFVECTALRSVELPETLRAIGDSAFSHCTALQQIQLPEGLQFLGRCAFYECSILAKAEIPGTLDQLEERTFYRCELLREVVLGDGITAIGREVFYGCKSLSAIELPESLRSIGESAFSNCAALREIQIPEGVISLGRDAFYRCQVLKSADLPSTLEVIGDSAFSQCAALSQLTIAEGVLIIGESAFSDCGALTSVNLPSTLTEIGKSAFYRTGLKSIRIPEGVSEVKPHTFYECASLTAVELPESLISIGNDAFYNTGLTQVLIPNQVETIGERAFEKCGTLTMAQLGTSLKNLKENAFAQTGLKEIRIPEGVSSIGARAFYQCAGLASVQLPEGLNLIGSEAFSGCTLLQEILLPETLITIESSAFSQSGLRSITIPEGVSVLGYAAFSNCKNLTSVGLPSTLTTIPGNAFSHTGLTSVVIPEGVYTIEGSAFYQCVDLRSVKLPDSLISIGSSAFYQTGLEMIVIPEQVLSIESSLFADCQALSYVELPEGLISIASGAFRNCPALEELVIHPDVFEIADSAFDYHSEMLTLYVFPDSYAMEYAKSKGINYEVLTSVVSKLTLSVLDEHGTNVSDGLEIRWYRNGELVGTGRTIRCGGSVSGYGYQVVLDEALSYRYHAVEYIPIPEDSDGTLVLTLSPIQTITLSGLIENHTGNRLPATVTVVQRYGAYEKTGVYTVDESGVMLLEVDNVATELLLDGGSGYYSYRLNPEISRSEATQLDLGQIVLYPIPEGNRIRLTVELEEAAPEGEERVRTRISDLSGIQFALFNETTGKALTTPKIQGNTLHLADGEVSPGDKLLLTASGMSGVATANRVRITMESDLTAEATVVFVENGGFELESLVGCEQILVMVFDSDGIWHSSTTVSGSYTSEALAPGEYQIVLVQDNSYVRCVKNVQQLETLGLVSAQDYLLQRITVKNGVRTVVEELQVPALEQSRFDHTVAELTGLSLTKSRFPLGQYVSARLSFALQKPYDEQMSDQTIIIELPEGLSLVEGSVYQDGAFLDYTLTDGSLTIPIGKSSGVIGFYLYGQEVGEYPLSALLRSEWNGQTLTQNLASVPVTVENAVLRMEELTSRETVSVPGSALKNSTVSVYDNGTLVGTTKTNSAGSWDMSWELTNYSTYFVHSIHTVIENELFEDPVVTEAQNLVYDAEYPKVTTVTVLCDQASDIVFNFEDPASGTTHYSLYSEGACTITYVVKFGEKSANARDVQLNTFLPDGRAMGYAAQYSEALDAWVVVLHATTNELPENVGVEFDYERPADIFSGLGSTPEGMEFLEHFDEDYHDYLESQISFGEMVQTEDGFRLDMMVESAPEEQISYYFTLGDYSDYDGLDLAEEGFAASEEDADFFVRMDLSENAIEYICVDTGERTVVLITVPMSIASEEDAQTPGIQPNAQNTPHQFTIFQASSFGRKIVTVLENLPAPPTLSSFVGMGDNVYMISLLQREFDAYIKLYTQTREMLNAKCEDGAEKYSPTQQIKYLDELSLLLEEQSQFREECQKLLKEHWNKSWCSLGLDCVTFGAGKWITKGAKAVRDGSSVFPTLAENAPEALTPLMKAVDQTVLNLDNHELRRKLSLGAARFASGWADAPEGSLDNPVMGAINAVDNVIEKFDPTGQTVHYTITNGYNLLCEKLYALQRQILAEPTNCQPEEEPDEDQDKSQDPDPIPLDPDKASRGPAPNAAKIVDPAGFLYEAVPSNRLEGVTVRAYWQDENGEAVLWNAEDYDQKNPLTTDRNGCYAWFVPFGMWQVEAELKGYETAYSQWLPVPPPQMEVHIGMISKASPEVEAVMVTPDQVIVVFSQYMNIESVYDALNLQVNGSEIAFETEATDREFDLAGAKEYATRFMLTPERPLTGSVLLTVSADAVNYAGTCLTNEYQSEEQLLAEMPEQINMREEYVFVAGTADELNLTLLPGLAGQTLEVVSSMPSLLQVDTPTITTDEQGKGTVALSPLLPGSCTITVTDPVTGLTATAQVRIYLTEQTSPGTVTATLADGTALETEMTLPAGTTVVLSTDEAGCEIRYTLDGSCPCRAGALVYTEPLIILQDTTLRVAAVRNGVYGTITTYDLKVEQGHVHDYTSVVTEATCTEGGYTTYTCSICGDSYVADETTALDHEFVEGTCIRCGVEDPDYETPTEPQENPFGDVKETDYFYEPVLWAVDQKITAGTGEGTFSPNATCTRAQVVTFLWRTFGKPEPASEENPFDDVTSADYFYEAVLWAVENGITSGTGNGKFSPNNPCTRDQVVTFLWRAMGKPEPEQKDNPFTDVSEQMYYYTPVLWAVEEKITSGTSATTFAPSDPCTRGQVVTFLYRAMTD